MAISLINAIPTSVQHSYTDTLYCFYAETIFFFSILSDQDTCNIPFLKLNRTQTSTGRLVMIAI